MQLNADRYCYLFPKTNTIEPKSTNGDTCDIQGIARGKIVNK